MDKAVSAFASKPVSYQALHKLLQQFHRHEANLSPTGTHHMPFKGVPLEFKAATRKTLTDHLSSASFADNGENGLASAIMRTGIGMRLHSSTSTAIQELTHLITADSIRTLVPDILFEACNILHAQRDWPKLSLCALKGGQHVEIDDRSRAIFCDWFVLSAYKKLMPAFAKNQLLPAQIDEFEASVTKATSCLSERGKNRIFYRALFANLRKKIELSVSLILKAQQAEGHLLGFFERLECFKSPAILSGEKSTLLAKLDANCQHNFIHENAVDPILLISCDKAYFDKYFGKLLESFGHWNLNGLLHLHCIAFEPERRLLEELEHRHKVRINFTVDPQAQLQFSEDNFMGYCAGARYIFLPTYLDHYSRIVITDIDGVIRRSLKDLWAEDQDAILLTSKLLDPEWHSARLLWETIAAGTFGITNAPKNRLFATLVSTFLCDALTSSLQDGSPFFYTDQIGLLLAYLRCKDTHNFERLQGLYIQGGSWQFSDKNSKRDAQQNINFRKS